MADLEKKIARLEHDYDVLEMSKNPVQEGGDLDEVYAQVETHKKRLHAKDEEIATLRKELDQYKYAVDDERPTGGGLAAAGAGVSPSRVGGSALEHSDDWGTLQANQRAGEESERRRLWAARHATYYAAKALRPGSLGIVTDAAVPLSRLAEASARVRVPRDAR